MNAPSRRDLFAAVAMHAYLSDPRCKARTTEIAAYAYEKADAMLAAPPAPPGPAAQPVGWGLTLMDGQLASNQIFDSKEEAIDSRVMAHTFNVVTLYAHPAAPAGEAERLQEQIRVMQQAAGVIGTDRARFADEAARLRKLLKVYERYHNKVGCPGPPDCYVCKVQEEFDDEDAALGAEREEAP